VVETEAPDYKYSSVLDLHRSDNANTLIRSHESVVAFYEPKMAVRELCHDFVKGNHWTDEERETARQKKKALVEFNKLKTSERTFVGSIIQQRYDVKPAPREPTDQNKADVYTAMYHWTADVTDVRYKDPGLVRDAWAGGNAWQESYVEITPGRKPRIIVENQNTPTAGTSSTIPTWNFSTAFPGSPAPSSAMPSRTWKRKSFPASRINPPSPST